MNQFGEGDSDSFLLTHLLIFQDMLERRFGDHFYRLHYSLHSKESSLHTSNLNSPCFSPTNRGPAAIFLVDNSVVRDSDINDRYCLGIKNTMRKYSLLVLLFFGLAGVLIDRDHLIIQQTQMARPFHLPIWVGLCIVAVGYYAYYHRRVHDVDVKRNKNLVNSYG